MSQDDDRLLYVVSARGEMSWAAFKDAFALLRSPHPQDEPAPGAITLARYRARRALSALGHCDFAFGDGQDKIYAAPPVLTRLPQAGPAVAVLAGARVPGMTGQIEEVCAHAGSRLRVRAIQQDSAGLLLPSRVTVEGGADRDYAMVAHELGITYAAAPAAWALAHFAGGLDDYLSTCSWRTGAEPNWPREDFDPEALRLGDRNPASSPARVSSYRNRVRHTRMHVYWAQGRWAEVDLDWGRYAMLRELGRRVLRYDPWRCLMAVPAGTPLPVLLERALVLCSGFVPGEVWLAATAGAGQERRHMVYRDVPAAIAGLVARKAGQALVEGGVEWAGGGQ